MMAKLKRLIWPDPIRAVTHLDVAPAVSDPEREAEVKRAQAELVSDLMRAERRSWEVRQELADNVLAIVSGEQR